MTTKGLTGFTNFGATCYMNSALQALCATKPLIAYLLHPKSQFFEHLENRIIEQLRAKSFEPDSQTIKDNVKCNILYSFRQIMRIYWKFNCEIKPSIFICNVKKSLEFFGDSREQHDSQEFLTALLDVFHENLKIQCNTPVHSDEINTLLEIDDTIEKELKSLHAIKEQIKRIQPQNQEGVIDNQMNQRENEMKTVHDRIKTLLEKKQCIYKLDENKYIDNYATIAWYNLLKKSYSIINDIFSGLSMTVIKCTECSHEYHRFERFDMLTLYIPDEKTNDSSNCQNEIMTTKNYTLDELIKFYSKTEIMDNDNKFHCIYCNTKQNATKQINLYQLPQTLVFMIKKYKHVGSRIVKNAAKIDYPHNLNMSTHIAYQNNDQTNHNYNLYSVIRHMGSLGSGHYYAYNKNHIDNLWYMHDDESVYKVDDTDTINSNGYILFYQRT